MKEPGKIIDLPEKKSKEIVKKHKHKTKENIINFELFKKYKVIVLTC